MRGLISILIVLLVAGACQAKPMPPEFVGKYTKMVHQVLEADAEMCAQLELTARKLEQFYQARGHLPRTKAERELFQRVLGKYIIDNPFHPIVSTVVAVPETETKPPIDKDTGKPLHMVPLFWLEDDTLSDKGFINLVRHPDESWRLLPGTILVLTNADNTYLICAMAEDGTPMRDLALPGEPVHAICKRLDRQHNGQIIAHSLVPAAAARNSGPN